MIRVRHRKINTATKRTLQRRVKADLVFPSEDILVVFDEAVDVMPNGIWRIYEQEVAFPSLINGLLEILVLKKNSLKRFGPSLEIVCLRDHGCFRTNRHVELTISVLTVETVPTCSVQIQELRGTGGWFPQVLASEPIVVVFGMCASVCVPDS